MVLATVILIFFSFRVSGGAETLQSPPTTLEEFRNRIKAVNPRKDVAPVKPERYWTVSECQRCHDKLFQQYQESMHARSFENPVFQALYFKDVVPRALRDNEMKGEAMGCISCHAPVVSVKEDRLITSRSDVKEYMSGVTCDFCHTITGYTGKEPGNANYISEPGTKKRGPFEHDKEWHQTYSRLHTWSRFCAICHQRTNGKGLEIITTFKEWEESEYAKRNIQCQDCHMNVNGFLTGGKAEYESGKAADMLAGRTPVLTPYREKLYTHRFPGAHSRSQVVGALTLDLEIDEKNVLPGKEITVTVLVDNSRSGHKMPTGSAELRLLWLEVRSVNGEEGLPLSLAYAAEDDTFGITGKGMYDKKISGDDIPEGSRLYRAVLVDEDGHQTLKSYDAAEIIFDNRLKASEVRKETYSLKVSENAEESIELEAILYYLAYPDAFAEELEIAEAEVIEIASKKLTVKIRK